MTVVTDAFADLGKEVAGALGFGKMATTVVEHPIGGLSTVEVEQRGRAALADIMAALRAERRPPRPDPLPARGERGRFVEAQRTWEAVNDFFSAQGWTDGLPVVPPNETRVAALVTAARAAPDDIIGVIPPRMGLATLEKVAVNAVMAGCEAEHFPVVLAAVKAVCAPEFNLLPMQATTNPVTPLVIVNGPIAQRLAVNAGCNAFGQGWKANAVIGRALRFVLLNIGGGAPGSLDHACHGQPGKYTFCFAENEAQSPWAPFHVERGFKPEESTVSVIGVAGTQDVIHYARKSADEVLATLVHAMPREGLKNLYSGGQPLLVFGPEQAAILHAGGLTKADVKRAFFERTRIPLTLLNADTIALLEGRRPEWFRDAIPDAVPIADSAEDVLIVVAGGAGNHTAFLPTWGDTRCVTVRIEV